MNVTTTDTMPAIDPIMQQAWQAFDIFRQTTISQRAALMRCIAEEIEALGDELIHTCMAESHLPEARLRNEKTRTIFQWNSYAAACEQGHWLEVRIDTANAERNPPKPDIRKMNVPLGPVVVFGASNFPFAFSTAGGDTASAMAAGCPVIVKAHNAHIKTSVLMASAIDAAVKKCGLPAGIFSHVAGPGNETGEALVMHPYTKAVGFTGSFRGGEALWKLANSRREPIPVFAEMSSINPVFLLPGKMKTGAAGIAKQLAASITLGCGQFCTNPGLIIGLDNTDLGDFINVLSAEIRQTQPATMLHPGIAQAYGENRKALVTQPGVDVLAEAGAATDGQGSAAVATVTAAVFMDNPALQQEVFGPFSLVVRCKDLEQMLAVARRLEGQLTATLMADEKDLQENITLTAGIQQHCGRLIVNNVPTGVEVCISMQHGGPWPASTDSRFTSVGADAIKRFVRPLCFQNWPGALLPDALKNSNPLNIWRTVNNELTKGKIQEYDSN